MCWRTLPATCPGNVLKLWLFRPTTLSVRGCCRDHIKDPFDRMLIAQAQAENIPILSNDAAFDTYNVRRLW